MQCNPILKVSAQRFFVPAASGRGEDEQICMRRKGIKLNKIEKKIGSRTKENTGNCKFSRIALHVIINIKLCNVQKRRKTLICCFLPFFSYLFFFLLFCSLLCLFRICRNYVCHFHWRGLKYVCVCVCLYVRIGYEYVHGMQIGLSPSPSNKCMQASYNKWKTRLDYFPSACRVRGIVRNLHGVVVAGGTERPETECFEWCRVGSGVASASRVCAKAVKYNCSRNIL